NRVNANKKSIFQAWSFVERVDYRREFVEIDGTFLQHLVARALGQVSVHNQMLVDAVREARAKVQISSSRHRRLVLAVLHQQCVGEVTDQLPWLLFPLSGEVVQVVDGGTTGPQ